jgi:hypothetical protein
MAFSVSGCEALGDSAGEDPLEPEYIPTGVPVEGAAGMPSIKEKFGVTLEGTAGVNAAFLELSAYIQGGGLSSPGDTVIQLGDWIDLEGGLTVDAYGTVNVYAMMDDTGAFDITPSSPPFDDYEGKLLRLIVVGINSFHSGRGVKADETKISTVNGEDNGQYTIQDNDDTPHVVFQFQDIPVFRRMDDSGSNAGGYRDSEMRKYLLNGTNYDDVARISFLAGLENAGVPEAVLWAPKCYVSARITYDAAHLAPIEDVLWLPTAREMLGSSGCSTADETAENQAWFEYYDSPVKRKKHDSSSLLYPYWEASQLAASVSSSWASISFCVADSNCGYDFHARVWSVLGCAPAFCVK